MRYNKHLLLVLTVMLVLCLFFAGCGAEMPETPETTEDQVPETTVDPTAIASVITGDQVVWTHNVEELLNAVDVSGNSVVTLYQDISNNKALEVPYSCTIDFNGFSVTTNPQQGLGIQIRDAGTENQTTTLKNGQLVSYSDSIRIKEGALVLSNMQITTTYGNCVALYDAKAAYKDINRIENTTMVSAEGACLSYSETGADFSGTGITLNNVNLISSYTDGGQILTKMSSDTITGQINLEDKVSMYSYNQTACPNGTVFLGKLAVKEFGATATIGDQTFTDMTLWTTESDKEVLDILMIGNSFCYSYVDELYGLADSLGYQLNITNLYYAGASIKSHWTWLDDPAEGNGKCEYWVTGPLGRYKHPTITTLVEAQKFADWDVISCQQHFDGARTVDFAAGYESCMPYAEDMFRYLGEKFPKAKLYWHETWAYGVGYIHPKNKDEDPNNDVANGDVLSTAIQTRQYQTIREVSAAICSETGVSMIPTGDAWQLARAQLGDTLNKPDFCHDGDAGGGQYLTACVWLEILTGESCIGNTWRPVDYMLHENKIPALQQAAHDAVAALKQ